MDALEPSLIDHRLDFVYCRQPQPVARYNTDAAVRDIGLLAAESKPKLLSDDMLDQGAIKLKKYWDQQ